MDATYLQQNIEFDEDGPVRRPLFETERIFSQVVSLGRNQSLGPIGDPDADAVLTIVAGEVVVFVDRSRKRLKQWGAALVPAGAELTVRNASPDPAILLLVTAPPPAPPA